MRKGMALVWALLLMGILSIISATIATNVIMENRIGIDIEGSAKAYSVARTGIDWGETIEPGSAPSSTTRSFASVDGYALTVIISRPSAGLKTVESEASNGKVRRKIKYEYKEYTYTDVSNTIANGTLITGQNGSFKMKYNLWVYPGTLGDYSMFGLQNSVGATGQKIGVKTSYDNFPGGLYKLEAFYTSAETGSFLSDPIYIEETSSQSQTYRYEVELTYTKDTSLKLSVNKACVEASCSAAEFRKFSCYRTVSVDMTNKNPSQFTGILAIPTTANVVDPTMTDTDGALSLGNILFIDNIGVSGFAISAGSVDWLNLPPNTYYVYKQDAPTTTNTWDQANTYCSSIGGRLPTGIEMDAIWNNRTSYNNNFSTNLAANYYWTSDVFSSTQAYAYVPADLGTHYYAKTNTYNVRCVK